MAVKNKIGLAGFAILLIAVPFVMSNQYYLSILIFAGINALAAMGLCMLMGNTGQISLGHAGFLAIGGYSSAILTRMHHWPPVAAMAAGVGISIVAALLIGIPSLRLKGFYLAMATLGFGEIVYIISCAAINLTQGPSGFSGIPDMSLAGFMFQTGISKYFLVWGFVFVIFILSGNIMKSRTGRALRSIHGDEAAAASMGIDVARYKIKVFVYSAILASIAGSLYVHQMRFVSPTGFSLNRSILFIIMILCGGIQSLPGVIAGAVIFTFLPEILGVFQKYDILIYGIILLGTMMFLPDGLAGLSRKIIIKLNSVWRKH